MDCKVKITNRKYFISVLVLFFLFTCAAYAGKHEVADFGCALDIVIPESAVVARISIPDSVYECVARSDLGDLRVFGKEGDLVSHSVKKPDYSTGQAPEPVSLPFFPVFREDEAGGDISMRVETGAGGSIINVKTSQQDKNVPNESPSSWLIDATSADKPFNAMNLEWSGGASSIFDVFVEAGDDLSKLRKIAGPLTLAALDYGGHRLDIHKLVFPLTRAKYIRLTWPKEAEKAMLSSVKVFFPEPGIQPEMRWKEIKGQKKSSAMGSVSGKAVYEFDTGGLYPVEKVGLVVPGNLGVLQGVLMSRPDLASDWRSRFSGIFYDLVLNGKVISGGSGDIQHVSDRFWKFETVQESAIKSEEVPVLKIGWVPHELYFLSGSRNNCVIAFGRTGLGSPSDNAVDHVLAQMKKDPAFSPVNAKVVELNGQKLNFHPASNPYPIRKIILWGILVAGVMLTGFMAYRLYRQMGSGGS